MFRVFTVFCLQQFKPCQLITTSSAVVPFCLLKVLSLALFFFFLLDKINMMEILMKAVLAESKESSVIAVSITAYS